MHSVQANDLFDTLYLVFVFCLKKSSDEFFNEFRRINETQQISEESFLKYKRKKVIKLMMSKQKISKYDGVVNEFRSKTN